MILRIASIYEHEFLICLKYGIWGGRRRRFGKWKTGDLLAITVDKRIAGLAKVDGEPYYSTETVWDNGVFPGRIPVKFIWVLDINDRPHLQGSIRAALVGAWGTNYGWGILNQMVLEDRYAKVIVDEVCSRPNALEKFQRELSARIENSSQ